MSGFREDFLKLWSMLPAAKVLALTATANKDAKSQIIESLNMDSNATVITASSDRWAFQGKPTAILDNDNDWQWKMAMKNRLLPVTTKVNIHNKSMVKHFTATAKGAEALAYGPQQEYIYKYKIYTVHWYTQYIDILTCTQYHKWVDGYFMRRASVTLQQSSAEGNNEAPRLEG